VCRSLPLLVLLFVDLVARTSLLVPVVHYPQNHWFFCFSFCCGLRLFEVRHLSPAYCGSGYYVLLRVSPLIRSFQRLWRRDLFDPVTFEDFFTGRYLVVSPPLLFT